MISRGLKFYKFDLHIHTPASKCFPDKNIRAEQIIEKAIERGLKAIAITDHNSGKFISEIQETAKKYLENNKPKLIIFPGVEITCENKHLIALFDPEDNEEKIKTLLARIKLKGKEGDEKAFSPLGVEDVIKTIVELDGLAILAHADSTAGIIKSGGVWAQNIVRNPLLSAVEITKKETIEKRLIEGTGYGEKACYFASDNKNENGQHTLEKIGDNFTYFKVDEDITLESLRQCFVDPQTRIRQSYEYQEIKYPSIREIKIKGGFLDGAVVNFHEGLNSILGAKGSGKSLIIEFLRFVFNQPPHHESLHNDHKEKLEKQLQKFGKIEVKFEDATGKSYLVSREYNPETENPIIVQDLSDNSEKNIEVSQIFQIIFLSQGEIVKITEDETDEEARIFIDRFFDFKNYQNKIKDLESQLKGIDHQFAESLKAYLQVLDIQRNIKTLEIELDKLNRLIKNPIFEKFKILEEIRNNLKSYLQFVESLKQNIKAQREEIDLTEVPAFEIEDVPQIVKLFFDQGQKILKLSQENLINTEREITSISDKLKEQFDKWEENEFIPVKTSYNEAIQKSGGTQIALSRQREKIIKEIQRQNEQLLLYQKLTNQLENINKKRKDLLTKLSEAHKEYFDARNERCKFFTENSSNKLLVTVKERDDTTAFKNNLMKLKRGSYLRDEEIEEITKVSPIDFTENLLRYEYTEKRKSELLKTIGLNIRFDRLKQLADFLLNTYSYEELMNIQYKSFPKDRPEIKYNIGDNEFRSIKDVSTGQKCTALIIMALTGGEVPIIIDQPEDSLDIRSVWEDVCKKLRTDKEKRQFIFTTHNSSVAVASDSDKFTILEANAFSGKVLFSGAMDNEEIKEEVINYLEGGKPTYNLKKLKYFKK